MSRSLEHGLSSLRTRAVGAQILLILGIVISLVAFVAGGVMLAAELGSDTAYGAVRSQMYLTVLGGNAVLNLLVFLSSIIAILLWIHRAHANLRTIGLRDLNYSPGWAVGSFFVPIANLFIPFRAMRELCNRSYGEEAQFAAVTVPDVNSWWTCFLVSNLIALFLGAIGIVGRSVGILIVTPPGVNTALALFANLLGIGAAIFLLRIVRSVTKEQQTSTGISQTFG